MRIPIIIPAYEPDERLIELLKTLVDGNRTIIIVNDGSSDSHSDIFTRAYSMIKDDGGILLTHEVNKGKGKALKTAFKYVIENIPDALGVITADSDGQHTVECIDKVADMFTNNPDCLVLGVRKFDGEDVPWKSRIGNNLTINVMRFVSGLNVSDTQTGLRAIPLSFMKELADFGGDRFEFETQMLLATVDKYEIKEVTIRTIYDSKENHQTHFNPIKDSIKIYKVLGKQFFKYLISSGSSAILDILIFTIVYNLFFSAEIAYITLSTVIARVCSATFNYAINYKKVFNSSESIVKSAIKYFILAIIQMGCSALFVTYITKLTNGRAELIKIIVDTLLFFISFKIQQRLVFAKKKQKN